MFLFWVFIFGLMVGSFLNVIIWRWPRGEEFVRHSSHCIHCRHKLAWYDMVPVLSWLTLGGKCRYCRKPIGVLYPVVELSHALAWVGVGYLAMENTHLGGIGTLGLQSWEELVFFGISLVVVSSLLVIWWIDWLHQLIPDGASLVLIVCGLILGFMQGDLLVRLYSAVGAGGFFLLLYLITKGRGMGLGDVKLAAGMGLLLGWLVAVALIASFWLGASVGVLLLALKQVSFGRPIAFGPFMVLGTGLASLWGLQIVAWYWEMFWVLGI